MFKRINKYNNKKVVCNGYKFDSKMEAEDYKRLLWLEKAGKIKDLKRQVGIKLSGRFSYVCDFCYYDMELNTLVIYDTKGFETSDFKIKRAWVLDKYTGYIFITRYRNDIKTHYPLDTATIDITNAFK